MHNLRLGLRQIYRRPVFAATIVLTLGLAIGANTAIFSFVNALLIRPFPFRDPDQLVEIRSIRGGQRGALAMREILDMQDQLTTLESIAAHTGDSGGYNFSGGAGAKPEEWKTILTTGNLFDVLGVPLALGAPWPQPLDKTRDYRVILTHAVWQRDFGGRRDIVGTTITLDHAPGYHIDGVAAKGIDFPRGIDVYRSVGGFANFERRDSRGAVGIARISRPHTVAELQAELDALAGRLAAAYPTSNAGLTFRATSFQDIYTGDVRPYLLLLMSAVGFVLLIACANVVNLLLAKGWSRDREIAVRIALGASRRAIVGLLLTESAVLAALAGAAGLALGAWWMTLLRTLIGTQLPEWMTAELDGRVLAFALLTAMAAGVLSGLAPALQVYRDSFGASLGDAQRGSSRGKSASRLRDAMIVGQVALAIVLLSGAGLLIRGFVQLQAQEKGFRDDGVASFRVALGWKRYGGEAVARYYERAVEQLMAIPGVERVGFIYSPPLSGLTFSSFDRKDADPVAVISARLARLLWPGQDAIGRRLQYNPLLVDPANVYRTVVGVVGDVQHRELGGEPSLDLYVPFRQTSQANQFLLAKTRLPMADFQRRAEQALWAIDPEQSLFDFQMYDERVLASVWQLRVSRLLLTLFGGVAIVLSAIGMYGVMSYLVGQRMREMAIRLALGARPAHLWALVVGRGVVLSLIGSMIGLAGSLVLGRWLAHQLRGVAATDPLSVGLAFTVLLTVSVAACAIPAWRASRSDPAMTLRLE